MKKEMQMKKILSGVLALAVIAGFALPAEGRAAHAEVRLAPIARTFAPPSLRRNQGWLTITNRDWKPYTVNITRKGRMSLTPGVIHGGTVIQSGNSVTMAMDEDTWEILGPSGQELGCRVREGRTSTISLEPFGAANASGLRGVSNDGLRVRNEILVPGYTPPPPPVVVQRPPVIVHTPPPVIINRPPAVIVNRPGRPGRPGPDRRPTHRPPAHRPNRDRDGWNFSFGFNSN
jgi:hypothetical protein